MQNDDQNIIKNGAKLSRKDETFLREKFVIDYSKRKGWDKDNLSPTQMLEIVQQTGYKNPGMILS